MKKITRPMTPAEPVSVDDEIETIRRDQILDGDVLEFRGEPLAPMSAGSFALMQRTKNGLLDGNIDNSLADSAAFILMHIKDEDQSRHARRAIFSGNWDEYVYQWMNDNPSIHVDLMESTDLIISMLNRFTATLTKSGGPEIPQGKH